jgi:hypothetical protein
VAASAKAQVPATANPRIDRRVTSMMPHSGSGHCHFNCNDSGKALGSRVWS